MIVSIQIVGIERECAVLAFDIGVTLKAQGDEVGKTPPVCGLGGHQYRNLVGAIVA